MVDYIIFVYGTLRKHESNAHYLEASQRIASQAWVQGLLYDTGNGYPALKTGAAGIVYGELYKVNEETLKNINRLEGYIENHPNNLYDRIEIPVQTPEGKMKALVYIAGPSIGNCNLLIESGDWKVHQFFSQ